jgi:signal transduction histidine kinase
VTTLPFFVESNEHGRSRVKQIIALLASRIRGKLESTIDCLKLSGLKKVRDVSPMPQGGWVSPESQIIILFACLVIIVLMTLRLNWYRSNLVRSFMLLQRHETELKTLKEQLSAAQTTAREDQKIIAETRSELVLFREITSILGQTYDFDLSIKSAFFRMLGLLSIDFGILTLGNRGRAENAICFGISENLFTALENVAERDIVLEEDPKPMQTVYFADFQKARVLDAMRNAHSLLSFACNFKARQSGSFTVGFHKRHSYTQSELNALQFCADQFAVSHEISKQLLYTQELAQLRQEYMYNVSHELKGPLTTINGYLAILRSYPPHMLQDSERSEMFSVMTDECHRLIRLINNLLLSVQVEQDDFSQKFHPVPISLGEVVSQALRFMDRDLQTKNIQVVTDIPAELSSIGGNSDFLYQVFQNLISNSIKFCGQKPKIEIVGREEENSVTFYLSDNGVGIAEQDLPKIFQKFYRSKSQSALRPGLGIGLYLVQKLVNLHQGEIRVTSELNKGTMFVLKFPKLTSNKSMIQHEQ